MSTYRDHQNLIKKFTLDIQKEIKGIRIFDRHVGLFYKYRVLKAVLGWFKSGCSGGINSLKLIFKSYYIQINMKGMADCYALLKTKYGLLHIEFEFKTGKARQDKDQITWQKFIERNNGIYMVIREDYDLQIAELKNRVESLINATTR